MSEWKRWATAGGLFLAAPVCGTVAVALDGVSSGQGALAGIAGVWQVFFIIVAVGCLCVSVTMAVAAMENY
jgi:hypothetical protein